MDKYEKRVQRIKEIFEEERDDVLACRIIKQEEEMEKSCAFCNCLPYCTAVFKEEKEG